MVLVCFVLVSLVSTVPGISAQCLMCAFTVNMTVQHEENVTLSCNVNSSSGVACMDESHFQLKEGNSTESVSFRIIRAGEADIGLYYCAVGISEKGMQFGTPVRLTFSDTKRGGFSHTANSVGCRTLSICAYAACGLSGVICMCVLFYRQVLCVSCGKENSNSEAADVQYASLRFVRPSRAAVPASVNGGQSPDVEPGLVVHC
ncbi:uncharacterized protein LOC130415680 isoform X3 [Triplophysa dalaica]|uniref:uncharacterized protein LOC130415680 isoform X3 n=1 Tax=Triplophysa dalaica TaxID=1582913 RepID=UPI0024E0216A|nr:uncharacterized protein LOC130415680 isoform X3 [Triplophysa dalaica]